MPVWHAGDQHYVLTEDEVLAYHAAMGGDEANIFFDMMVFNLCADGRLAEV